MPDPTNATGTLLISIHAPRTGSDIIPIVQQWEDELFQSTLPARGATRRQRVGTGAQSGFQSTLPARGATIDSLVYCAVHKISIHAPRTGSDYNTGIT